MHFYPIFTTLPLYSALFILYSEPCLFTVNFLSYIQNPASLLCIFYPKFRTLPLYSALFILYSEPCLFTLHFLSYIQNPTSLLCTFYPIFRTLPLYSALFIINSEPCLCTLHFLSYILNPASILCTFYPKFFLSISNFNSDDQKSKIGSKLRLWHHLLSCMVFFQYFWKNCNFFCYFNGPKENPRTFYSLKIKKQKCPLQNGLINETNVPCNMV